MNSTECSVENCNRDAYKKNKECILHCKKGDYDIVFREQGGLFYKELIKYISDEIFRMKKETGVLNKTSLIAYLQSDENQSNEVVLKFAKKSHIGLIDIIFPVRDDRDDFDYLNALKKIGAIQFRGCKFQTGILELKETKCLYADCNFQENWSIYNSPSIRDGDGILYEACCFHKEVDILTSRK